VDSVYEDDFPTALSISAKRTGLLFAAHRGRVSAGYFLQAFERPWRYSRAARRFCFGNCASALLAEINKDKLAGLWYHFANINFLHFAIFLFIVCSAVFVGVSLTAPPASEEKLANLTYSTRRFAVMNPAWKRRDILLSFTLAAVVGLVWIYFNG
jgi:hypothetical protein